jgi:DNA-binding ferritin-like protein (Dps family)
MPEEFRMQPMDQQRNLNGPGQEPAPTPTPTQAPPAPTNNTPPNIPAPATIDADSFYRKAREDEQKAHQRRLMEMFGTADLDELAKKVQSPKNSNSEEVIKEMQALKAENERIKKESEQRIQRERFLSALTGFAHKPYEPTDVLDKILGTYEIRERDGKEVVFKRGEDVPVFIGSEMADSKKLIENFHKSHSWMFQSQSTTPHLNLPGNAASDSWNPKSTDFETNPRLMEGIEKSGQRRKFINGEPISRSLVDNALKNLK